MKSLYLIFVFVAVVSACSDNSTHCSTWKNAGFCASTSMFSEYMKQNCEATCGYCTAPPQPPTPPGCTDKSQWCDSYKDYCTHKDYIDYVQKECKLTCNYCHITTTQPPTTTTPKPYTGAAGKNIQGNCGHKGATHTRIVGGTNSKPGDWPWQASIRKVGQPKTTKNWCGASIINDEWILSAAHCFDDRAEELYSVTLGEHDLNVTSTWEQHFKVAELIVHPQYDNETFDYDYALLRLSTKVTFTDRVRPACIPEHGIDFPTGTECYITGWGLMKSYSSDFPMILQQAKVPLVDEQVCQKAFENEGYDNHKVTPRMLCAGYSKKEIDSCQGDSGGPLVCKKHDSQTNQDVWYLWGSMSWGVGCARRNLYGVYTDTKYMSDWIINIAYKN